MGIPLLVVTLLITGKYLSGIWDTILSRIPSKRFAASKNKDVYSLAILILIGFVSVVFIPALIFMQIDSRWSYKDAVYFAIVSLTTIGFGDYSPARQHLTELKYVTLYLTWLFIGFAMVSLLLTKTIVIYKRVNKRIIALSRRYFNKCLRIRSNNNYETFNVN